MVSIHHYTIENVKIEFMNRRERIISLLTQEFSPSRLEVVDDSASHAGHSGASPSGETHYHVVIEAAFFKEMTPVKRHQAIYTVLDGEFKSGLHALAIRAN